MADPTAESSNQKEIAPTVTAEAVKAMAESIGISTTTEDCCKYLADDVTYRLKNIIQDASKLALHSRRSKLSIRDVDETLKMKNQEPIYGFTSAEYIPFRNVSGGGRDLHCLDDKEMDLDDLVLKALPKVPMATSLKAHWLAIEGIQPAIPENAPPLSRDMQRLEGVNPGVKASTDKINRARAASKKVKDHAVMKPIAEHDLSVEQQLYYKEITEACVGSDEQRRSEALTSLAQDPGLHKMLPRFSMFISEGVKINCVNNNLAILIYLMRMFKSLLENGSLYLEKYLHELLPAVCTCIVSKQLCMKPDTDNHWALRDFSSKILGQVCKKFSTNSNDIQTRIVKLLSSALQNRKGPLATHYGCLIALNELGQGVVQSFILPIVKSEGERLQPLIDGVVVSQVDRIAAKQVKTALLRIVTPVLKATLKPPDVLEVYRQEYGQILGQILYEAVSKARQASLVTPPTVVTQRSSAPQLTQNFHSSFMQHVNPRYMEHRMHSHCMIGHRPPGQQQTNYNPWNHPYISMTNLRHRSYGAAPFNTGSNGRTTPPANYNSGCSSYVHGSPTYPNIPHQPHGLSPSFHNPIPQIHGLPQSHHWPSQPVRSGGNAVTILPQSVSRSFSIPGSLKTNPSSASVIRMSGPSSPLIRTPTTPGTPGQKYIIVASSASNVQSQQTMPAQQTIVKVVSGQTNQPASTGSQPSVSKNEPTS